MVAVAGGTHFHACWEQVGKRQFLLVSFQKNSYLESLAHAPLGFSVPGKGNRTKKLIGKKAINKITFDSSEMSILSHDMTTEMETFTRGSRSYTVTLVQSHS